MSKILIYIDNLERLRFYRKIILLYPQKFIVITHKLSVFFTINHLVKTYLLKKTDTKHIQTVNCTLTLSVIGNYHTLEQASVISQSILHSLDTVFANEEIKLVLVWNGTTTIGYTIGEYCKQNRIPIKFLELSNLSGKIFTDPYGVNAKSSLFLHPETLDVCQVPEAEYETWKHHYLHAQVQTPKQAANRSKIRWEMIYDYIGYYFLDCLREDYRNPFARVWGKFKNKQTIDYPQADLHEEYLFFPLQVSTDSQILLNSDIDNLEAIKVIQNQHSNKKVFIKIHPAEENRAFIRRVEQLQTDRIKIVGNATKELIQNASKVVTINSTVGLEALILDKEVEVLGRAVYSHFDHERLKAYVCRYLINIDYFDDEVNPHEAARLLDEK